MAARIAKLTLRGYKTYADVTDFPLGQLNILIGGNGSGKTNLLSFFTLLRKAMQPPGGLQLAVGKAGGASRLLTDGGAHGVDGMSAALELRDGRGAARYDFRLEASGDERFVVARELMLACNDDLELQDLLDGSAPEIWSTDELGSPELSIHRIVEGTVAPAAQAVAEFLRSLRVHHFEDTSQNSPIRSMSAVDDCVDLRPDGANLAALLMRLKGGNREERTSYQRIVGAIRLVLPFFSDFEFQPTGNYVLLRWREQECDQSFSVSQASDGMLRFVALATLLSLPEHLMPPVIIVDEPELGLHPEALSLIGELLKGASEQTQVIVATQSAELVDQFSIEDLVVVSRSDRCSKLLRLKEEDFAAWRENYSTGTLWRKNVIAAGPGE